MTGAGQFVGTLAYTSPEQIGREPELIDTRSDVYALGVILYELLAGRLPIDLRAANLVESARRIREGEPPALTEIDRGIPRDVATITAKALEKDRERRYQSAADLAADVRRFLRAEPILARPATTTYVLRKFARRHRGLVAGGVTVLGALIAAAVISRVQAVRAEDARTEMSHALADSDAVVDFFSEMLVADDPYSSSGEATVRGFLDRSKDGIDARFHGRPRVAARLRGVIGRALLNLDDPIAAEAQLAIASRTLAEKLGEDHPKTLGVRRDHAVSLAGLQRWAAAAEQFHDVIERATHVHGPGDPFVLQARAQLLCAVRFQSGDTTDLEEDIRGLLPELHGVLGDADPYTLETKRTLGELISNGGRDDEAIPIFLEVLETHERTFGPEHLRVAASLRPLGVCYTNQGRLDDATRVLNRSVRIIEQELGEGSPATHAPMYTLLRVHRRAGRTATATEIAEELLTRTAAAGPGSGPMSVAVMSVLGNLHNDEGRYEEAVEILSDARSAAAEVWPDGHIMSAEANLYLATSLLSLERPAEAKQMLLEAKTILSRPGSPPSFVQHLEAMLEVVEQRLVQ